MTFSASQPGRPAQPMAPPAGTQPIRVLVVDDSVFMRKSLSAMLAADSRITVVGTARNGEEAVQQVAALKPDVVTMDVEMPGMNGLDALKAIMQANPLPVIMVSSLTEEGAKETLLALELGAVDYVPKQLDGVVTKIAAVQPELVAKVIAAKQAQGKIRPAAVRRKPLSSVQALKAGLSSHTVSATRGAKIVAIGCSTGGPQALAELLPYLPADFPAPVVIVQHMPKFFTKPFADRMNQLCALDVREAQHGEEIKVGAVLIAPGGSQFRVKRRNSLVMEVSLSPNVEQHLHAPSADIMIASVAAAYGERGIGVILTGMGHDGIEGIRALKAVHGRTIAQDEASSIVYGMPKAVVDAKLADKVVPLSHVAGEILNMV